MNTSYRGSGDAPAILTWLKQFPYPHCKSANGLAALRSGVAIAEILTEKLPQAYHPLFLPNIEIYNLNPQRSMLNLRVMLDTLKVYCSQNQDLKSCLDDFTPEGLYFDHNMMEAFMFSVIMPLDNGYSQNQYIAKEGGQQFEQANDIANLSSIIVPQIEKTNDIMVRKKTQKRQEIDREELRIEKICNWLREIHHINVQQLQPQEIIGQLVNSAFTGSRLDHLKVVKQSHYQQGPVAVFKKVADYLLNCERMPKPNVLAMIEQIQAGCVREELFWNLIQDIMNIKASHLRKLGTHSRKKSIQKIKRTEASDKQNERANQKPATKQFQLVQRPVIQSYQCSQDVLKLAQQWIRLELGYDYSLKKAKQITCIQQNPLLNGVLLGSIIMRMQLGKVNINKEPKSKKDVDRNMSQVINCIIRRGIDAGRKFSKFKPTYSTYLGIIWEVKQELAKKTLLQKNKRAQQARQRKEQTKILATAEKQQITSWLKTRGYEIDELVIVPASLVSQVCGQILQLRLLRQTTKKIQHNNISKILNEIRRLGWEGEGESSDILSQQGNQLRWGILKFALELVKFKVYYYK